MGLAPIYFNVIPWAFAIGILVYGYLIIKKEEKSKLNLESNS